MIKLYILLLLTYSMSACAPLQNDLPYDFMSPARELNLEKKLEEISGLHFKEKRVLYAVQDEEGKIYEINVEDGSQSKVVDFKKKGDYEGLSKVGEFFYILRSDGAIYQVDEEGEVMIYPFYEDGNFEFEGICADKTGEYLYLACKKHTKKKKDDDIWIYRFSLDAMAFDSEEALRISKKNIHPKFRASGIAMNEKDNIYLVSSNTYCVVSMDLDGNILGKSDLSPLLYAQTEGICFGNNETLYLASEKGEYNYGKLFELKKNEN